MKIPTVFMPTQASETSPSAKSPRSISRSVRGMKSLLPLHLSPAVAPTSRFSESQQEDKLAANEEEEERVGNFRRHRRSPPSRRDFKIYAPKDCPVPDHAFYSQQDNGNSCYSMPAPPRRPYIVNDYELTDSDEVDVTPPRHTINVSRDYHRSPRWGQVMTEEVFDNGMPLPLTEPEAVKEIDATWVSSPRNQWNDGRSECLPYVLSQDMPVRRWLRESSSWLEDEDDNVLACATALAPAKANVVDVNKRDMPGLTIEIPPRISSLSPREEPRASWMTFGDSARLSSYSSFLSDTSEETEEEEEETISRPAQAPPPRPNSKFMFLTEQPLSPTSLSGDSFLPSTKSPPTIDELSKSFRRSPKRNSLHETISDLETHLSAFPTWMMTEDSTCVSSIRSYLKLPTQKLTTPRQRADPPLSPALSLDTGFLDASTALESNPFDSHIPTIPTAFTQQLLDAKRQSFGADLQPLARIFPDTSIFMQSALYAHLLAYIFVTSLTPSFNVIPATPPLGFSRPTSNILPSKAAELLGINPDLIIPSATKALEDQLVGHIATLVNDMENPPGTAVTSKPQPAISRITLMALVEVVRAAEGA